jgi:ABC-type multidrug transport system fused ATPase/permease subunit
MLSLDWQLALIAFAAVPPVALLVNWTRRRIRDAFREIRVKTARMNTYLNEQVSGMAVVQAYAREERGAEFDAINARTATPTTARSSTTRRSTRRSRWSRASASRHPLVRGRAARTRRT